MESAEKAQDTKRKNTQHDKTQKVSYKIQRTFSTWNLHNTNHKKTQNIKARGDVPYTWRTRRSRSVPWVSTERSLGSLVTLGMLVMRHYRYLGEGSLVSIQLKQKKLTALDTIHILHMKKKTAHKTQTTTKQEVPPQQKGSAEKLYFYPSAGG